MRTVFIVSSSSGIGAEKHHPPAQIALRQHIQRGIVIIPKSVHKDRMKQNLIFSTLH